MAYLRCTQCGAKALSVASQCPRCHHAFDVHDARGMRVKLAYCRGCGFMHRHDAACPTCGVRASRSVWTAIPWQRVAAVACMVTVVGATWRFGPSLRDVAPRALHVVSNVTSAARAPLRGVASRVEPTVNASSASNANASAADASLMTETSGVVNTVDARSSVAMPGANNAVAPTVVMVADSVRWVPAVARTWVNVRSDASRGGSVVGVIKPSSRAMLGVDRAGWRLVKSPEVSGWVDPRLFDADSVRSRGE
ncbi:MAG: hypothetical protein RLZZ621_1818 [Gemmatimonadota bacterium]